MDNNTFSIDGRQLEEMVNASRIAMPRIIRGYREEQVEESVFVSEDDQILDELEVPIPTPQRSTLMNISLIPSDNTVRLREATVWLTRILDSPTLGVSLSLPNSIKGYIYINDVPHMIHNGSWANDGSTIYMPSHSGQVEPLTRIAILASIANFTGAIENPAIAEKISTRLVQAVSESIRSTYAGMIRSTQRPTRLAIDQIGARVAAEINGSWLTTSGAPVVVTDSWIVMDF